MLRRIAAKLGLSEAATSTLRLIKAGKVLDLSAASLLAKGDTVHVLSRLDGGIRIREVESASGAALTDAPCATSSDGDAEDASDVADVPDPACDDGEDDDDDSDDYESDGHAPGLSAMFHGMAELTNGRVCIAGSYALHHYLRVHRGESTGGRVGRRATSISSTARTAASSTVTSCAAASSTWRAAVRCRCAGRVKWAPSSSRRRRVTPPRSRATPSRTPRTRLVWPRLLASSSCRFVCASGRARESTRSSVALALRGCALAALLTRACAHRQVPDLLEHQARPRRRT